MVTDVKLKDCELNRSDYGNLSDEEYSILCGFLFPYAQINFDGMTPPAKNLVAEPVSFAEEILSSGKVVEFLQALYAKKSYASFNYVKEEDLRAVLFDDMIRVAPKVEDFLEAINMVREHLESSIRYEADNIEDDLTYHVSEYINEHQDKISEHYDLSKANLEFLVDIKKKVVLKDSLSTEELSLLADKKFLEFVSYQVQ